MAKKSENPFEKAEALLDNGKPEQALNILRKTWDVENESPKTYKLAGDAKVQMAALTDSLLEKKKLLRDAVKQYTKSLKIDPKNKETVQAKNMLENRMMELKIRTTSRFSLINDQTPTMLGLILIPVLIIGSIVAAKALLDAQNKSDIMIEIDLNDQLAPTHVQNFRLHADSGNYDGVKFHRIIDEFMVQGGDFENQDGSGGYAGAWYGYCNGQDSGDSTCGGAGETAWTVPDEANNGLTHKPGSLAMAKTSNPNTGGSQFYFVDKDSTPSHLDGLHTVFGQAVSGKIDGDTVSGIDAIDRISSVTTASDIPVDEIPTIDRIVLEGECDGQPDSICKAFIYINLL
ncbi:MAG TPA: peptidylprolyl isomerase [Candidatus Poseidoniaceae archaeon]|nr:peptidylprolyl isomerase [Candidatus Poseidoniaceae archaeon]